MSGRCEIVCLLQRLTAVSKAANREIQVVGERVRLLEQNRGITFSSQKDRQTASRMHKNSMSGHLAVTKSASGAH